MKHLRTNILFRKKSIVNNIVWFFSYLFLLVICAFQVFIVFWMIYTSLKDDYMLALNKLSLPSSNQLHFENYRDVLSLLKMEVFIAGKGFVKFGLVEMIKNSVLIAVCMPIAHTISSVITAYVISKYKFKGRELLIWINMIVMILPITGNLASALKVNNLIGRYDNLIMMCILGAQPFGFNLLIYIGMFNRVDNTYREAAQIDGAGNFRIFLQIMVPMIAPTIIVFYILAVLGNWNNYELPLVWLPSYANLALGMYDFQYNSAKYASTLPQVLAGFVLMSIPSIVFFGLNQKLITSKMMVGGLKG